MKLIASKDFFNSKRLRVKLDTQAQGFKHPDHVFKGARFNVGQGENYKDLSSQEQEDVGMLLKHSLAVLDNKENAENGVIKTIDTEAAAQFKMDQLAAVKPPTLAESVATAVALALAGQKEPAAPDKTDKK